MLSIPASFPNHFHPSSHRLNKNWVEMAQNYYFISLAAVALFAVSLSEGAWSQKFQNVKNLTAHYATWSLPSERYNMWPVYDGGDSVYLFGGYGPSVYPISEIVRFNISTETVERLQWIDTYNTIGQAFWDREHILFFAGSERKVYKFEPATSAFSLWDYSPVDFVYATIERYGSSIYFFGGRYGVTNRVVTFNLDTYNYTMLDPMPFGYNGVASTRMDNRVFLVGDQPSGNISDAEMESGSRRGNNILVYNLEDGSTTIGPDNFPTIPNNRELSMVNDGNNIYMIGTTNDTPVQGIMRIDPDSLELDFIYVNGWPIPDYLQFQRAPTSVYVKKLNRIYYFGGYTSISFGPIREIWYLDLAELEETS